MFSIIQNLKPSTKTSNAANNVFIYLLKQLKIISAAKQEVQHLTYVFRTAALLRISCARNYLQITTIRFSFLNNVYKCKLQAIHTQSVRAPQGTSVKLPKNKNIKQKQHMQYVCALQAHIIQAGTYACVCVCV